MNLGETLDSNTTAHYSSAAGLRVCCTIRRSRGSQGLQRRPSFIICARLITIVQLEVVAHGCGRGVELRKPRQVLQRRRILRSNSVSEDPN
jgi:hypothetical protein